eukprot:tig00000367_g24484.t1
MKRSRGQGMEPLAERDLNAPPAHGTAKQQPPVRRYKIGESRLHAARLRARTRRAAGQAAAADPSTPQRSSGLPVSDDAAETPGTEANEVEANASPAQAPAPAQALSSSPAQAPTQATSARRSKANAEPEPELVQQKTEACRELPAGGPQPSPGRTQPDRRRHAIPRRRTACVGCRGGFVRRAAPAGVRLRRRGGAGGPCLACTPSSNPAIRRARVDCPVPCPRLPARYPRQRPGASAPCPPRRASPRSTSAPLSILRPRPRPLRLPSPSSASASAGPARLLLVQPATCPPAPHTFSPVPRSALSNDGRDRSTSPSPAAVSGRPACPRPLLRRPPPALALPAPPPPPGASRPAVAAFPPPPPPPGCPGPGRRRYLRCPSATPPHGAAPLALPESRRRRRLGRPVRRPSPSQVRRSPALVALMQRLMRAKREGGAPAASPAHLARVQREAEEHGPRLRALAAAVAAFSCRDEAALLAFHREVEAALAPLEDEARTAALCCPEARGPPRSSPTSAAPPPGEPPHAQRPCFDAAADAGAGRSGCGSSSPASRPGAPRRGAPRGPALPRRRAGGAGGGVLRRGEAAARGRERSRDEELRRFKASGLHFDAGLFTRAKHAAIRPAEAAVRAAVAEGRRAREAAATAARRKAAGATLFRALALAQRAYVLAGGADGRLEAAVSELAELLGDAQAWL